MFKLVTKSKAVSKLIQRIVGQDGLSLVKQGGPLLCHNVLPVACHTPSAAHSTKAGLGTEKETAWESINRREVLTWERYRHVKNTGMTRVEMEPNGKFVDIAWEDGHLSRFHAIWLRHQCHCASCRLPHTSRIAVDFEQLDVEHVKVLSVFEEDGVLILTWQDRATADSVHEGFIPAAYLRAHCYSDKAMLERRQEAAMTFSDDSSIPTMDYNDVRGNEKGIYEWMKLISERGMCLLKNVPTENDTVLEVGEIVGPIMRTWYGDSFDVQAHAHTDNPNFTSVRLYLHMDLVYYESPPGLQLLHCLDFDPRTVGGESVLKDIFKLVGEFRETNPEDFKMLCEVPIMFETIHYHREPPVHLQTNRPIIHLNNRDEIVSVAWHPMTFGALKCSPELVEPFYRAYGNMFKAIQQSRDSIQHRLRPGDCLCFNNRRILHARNAFQVTTGSRLLQGTYVEITAFQGLMQTLHNRHGHGQLAMKCGNFDYL